MKLVRLLYLGILLTLGLMIGAYAVAFLVNSGDDMWGMPVTLMNKA